MLAKRYSSDRTAAIKRTKDRSSSTAPEAGGSTGAARRSFLCVRRRLHRCSTSCPHVFHNRARRRPRRRASVAAVAAVAVAVARAWPRPASADGPAAASPASTYRLFLRDGSSVATIGEFARTGDRVVVTIGLGDRLTMTTRAGGAGRLGAHRSLHRVGARRALRRDARRSRLRGDERGRGAHAERRRGHAGRAAQLALAERARRQLADWPREHYGYRAEEVRQTLALLDEVIAGLRAAAGQTAFDVAFVANVLPPPPEPVLPPPTLQDSIEQALRLSLLAAPGAERTALATRRRAPRSPPRRPRRGSPTARTRADRVLDDRAPHRRPLRGAVAGDACAPSIARAGRTTSPACCASAPASSSATPRSAAPGPRPSQGLLALVDARLDAARRLQLARDQWASRVPALRRYRRDVAPWLDAVRRASPHARRDPRAVGAVDRSPRRLQPGAGAPGAAAQDRRRARRRARRARRDARRDRPGRDRQPRPRPRHRDAEPVGGLGSVGRRRRRAPDGRARRPRRRRAAASARRSREHAPISRRRRSRRAAPGWCACPISRACSRPSR